MLRKIIKVGRNDVCPCGSTKKFKKCHGAPNAPRLLAEQQPLPSTPFTIRKLDTSGVPREVMEQAQRLMAEHEQRDRARINRFGHVRPEISGDFQGYKFVAIGG